MEWNERKVCIELKNGSKYFGKVIEVDDSPKSFSWITLIDKTGVRQIFADSEIVRVEVLE